MARGVRAAIAGWLTGFAFALAWSATQSSTPGSGSALVPWAVGGFAVLAGLLGVVGLRDSLSRRREAHEALRDREWFERMQGPVQRVESVASFAAVAVLAPPPPPPPPPLIVAAPAPDPRVATAAANSAAARIALLEARLALEQEQLDEAMRHLEEQDLAASESGVTRIAPTLVGQTAAEAEPALREELVEALAELVGRRADGTVAATDLTTVLLRRAG